MNFRKKSLGPTHIKPRWSGHRLPGIKKRHVKKVVEWLALTVVFLMLSGSIVVVSLLAWYAKDLPSPDELIKREIPQTTKIFDRTGEHLLYEISGDQKRTLVKFEDIPDYAKDAVILLEDKTFYEHKGLSLRGMARIVVTPVLCKINSNRFCSSGGSTITQQLVKNAILTNEKTISRKLKEILLTLEIERRYDKNQILQMYFNEIPYGSVNYGIESAAKSYFNKSAKELSIAEAATLAALPRAPYFYLNNQDKLKARRDYAIALLRDDNKITAAEAEEALASELVIAKNETSIYAPHFVFYVREKLEGQFGAHTVEQGGLKVTTSLNFDLQTIAAEEVKKGVETNGAKYRFTNASLVAIDPKTGQILSMVGSKDYFATDIDGKVNVAISDQRSPGSSIKPIIYTAAFLKGYTPETVLWDVETTFPVQPKPYTPHNYDLSERGPVTLRTALQGSLNIPAVKLLYLVGLDRALDFAKEMGYTTFQDPSRYGLSLVLGGGAVKLVEHVNAYATLANEGVKHPLASILRVEAPDGTVLYEWKEEGSRVVDENIARTTTDVLSDNVARTFIFGPSSSLVLSDRQVAAKTGTTNDYKDAWTVGYTPSLVAGVWAGNNDTTPMNRAGGNLAAAPIWNAFMKRALKDTPVEQFTKPTPLSADKPVLQGYRTEVPAKPDGTPGDQPVLVLKGGTKISNYGLCTPATIDKASGKLATEFTPADYRETRFFCEVHEIMHYVSKDDPLGPPPEDPKIDPMYQVWEDSLTRWLTAREVTLSPPPTDRDDLHNPALRPSVALLTPVENQIAMTRNLEFIASASGPRPISRIEYWIDDVKIGESRTYPYNLNAILPNRVSMGFHRARAIAYDDVDNSSEAGVSINVSAGIIPIPVSITTPADGFRIRTTHFPLNISVTTGSKVEALDLLFAKAGSPENFYGSTLNPATNATVTWSQAPEKGTYTIRVRARESGDVFHYSQFVTITVE
ncbi:MAG: penicillin-binding protein [bacterium]